MSIPMPADFPGAPPVGGLPDAARVVPLLAGATVESVGTAVFPQANPGAPALRLLLEVIAVGDADLALTPLGLIATVDGGDPALITFALTDTLLLTPAVAVGDVHSLRVEPCPPWWGYNIGSASTPGFGWVVSLTANYEG